MKILQVTRSLNPAGGGPAEGIRQFSQAYTSLGKSVEVVSLDAPTDSWTRDFPCPVHALGPTRLNYGYTPRLAPWLRAHAGEFDAIIVNGLWQYHALGCWRALRGSAVPYFVFPHGMLDPWFKRTYPLKHLKKWLYWPWADYRVLRDARRVLFTSEEERLRAPKSFWLYRCNEAVVGYGVAAPDGEPQQQRRAFFERFPDLRDKRLYLFLGRIHAKKGCDLLIDAFANVMAKDPQAHLFLAGPCADDSVARLKRRAVALQISQQVSWPGMLQGDAKWGAFRAAEAFVLPSHQENFGIAVVEALACGVPVLISDKVNIWREVDQDEVGLVAPDTLAGTRQLLERWRALPASEQTAMRARAQPAFLRRFSVAVAMARLLNVIGSAAATAGQPLEEKLNRHAG